VEGTQCFFANQLLVHNCLIVDDPTANREDADSDVVQDKTEEEYRDSLVSRLKPGGSIILISTRWSENDLPGRILPLDYKGQSGPVLCRDGMTWYVLNIPAEAVHPDDPLGRKPGEFLWPEWFPESHWLIRKNDPKGQRTWSALYQQNPTPGEGIEFQRGWFLPYDPDRPPTLRPGFATQPLNPATNAPYPASHPPPRPAHLTTYGGSDFAASPDRSADFTEHGVMGVDENGDIWLLDWWSDQTTSDVYIEAWIQLLRRWKPRKWVDEGGVVGHAIAPARTRAMREARPAVPPVQIEQLTSINNKALKLASFQAYAAGFRVHVPINRPWTQRVIDQLCGFPAARYDDAADVCGLFGRLLDEIATPFLPPPEERKIIVPFTQAWFEQEDDDQKPRIRIN
jgi:predicted phage terminase large subunit-like protein